MTSDRCEYPSMPNFGAELAMKKDELINLYPWLDSAQSNRSRLQKRLSPFMVVILLLALSAVFFLGLAFFLGIDDPDDRYF
jgi:type VI protein secretion system component VasF